MADAEDQEAPEGTAPVRVGRDIHTQSLPFICARTTSGVHFSRALPRAAPSEVHITIAPRYSAGPRYEAPH